MSNLLRKIKTASDMSWRQLVWLLPLFLLSGLARLAILILPFRLIAPFLGNHNQNTEMTVLTTQAQQDRAREMATAIRVATKYTPWESLCLVQALLARVVLRWYGIPHISYLGVTKSSETDNNLQAHAWVSTGRCFVSGGNSHFDYTVVSSFISDTDILPSKNHRPTHHAG